MWIVFRVCLALIGFTIRQMWGRKVPPSDWVFEGAEYFRTIHKTKHGIRGFTIGMKRISPTWVRLHDESGIDRLCKRLGIANELQTGDAEFDNAVYVTCDHPHVHTVLRGSPRLRAAVVAALTAGFTWIRFDGSAVRMRRGSDREPTDEDLRLLRDVWAASEPFEQEPPNRFLDPFLWKALLIEGAIWGLFGYAVGAFIEWQVIDEDHHVWRGQVIRVGLAVAAAGFALLVGVIALWMRGSSRGHRVIVESAIVLACSLPIAAIQFVSDTNRGLDDEPSAFVEDKVVTCETRAHRRKRSTYYTHHLHLAGEGRYRGAPVPTEIEVAPHLCGGLRDERVELVIAPGRWGIPWYRAITVGQQEWRSTR